MKEYLTIVELSTTKVAVAVGEKESSGIKVVCHKTTPLPKGIVRGDVVNAQKVIEALKETVAKAEEEISNPIQKIVLCQSSQFIRCEDYSIRQERSIADSFITSEEIAKITKKAEEHEVSHDEKIFAAIPQSYNVDDEIGISPADVEGMRGKKIEAFFKLVIGKKTSYDFKMEIASKCNLEVIHTVLSPIGCAIATVGENEAENGVALLDIGAGTTDVVIVKDNIIRYVGVIPFGGKSISDDIKNVTNVTSQHAEYIKTRYGRAMEEGTPENKKLMIPGTGGSPETNIQLNKLSAIIEARLTEIFEAVEYTIEQSGFANKITGIVITGGTAYIDEIKVLAKAVTGYGCRLANAQGKIHDKSAESCFDTYSASIIGCLCDSFEKGIEKIANMAPNKELFGKDHFTEKEPDVEAGSDNKNTDKKGQDNKTKNNSTRRSFFGRPKNKDDNKEKGKTMSDLFGDFFNDNNNA